MNRAMKVLAPLSCLALLLTALLLWKEQNVAVPSRPQASSSTQVAQAPVALPAAQAPAAAPVCPQKPQAAKPPVDDDDDEGPVTDAEARDFVKRVHEEMAKLGIDSYADPNFPANPVGTPEGGIVRDPTPEEVEQMKKEFAESEKVLRNLDRESPRDTPAPATK